MSNSRANPTDEPQIGEKLAATAQRLRDEPESDMVDELEYLAWEERGIRWAKLQAQVEAGVDERRLKASIAKRADLRADAILVFGALIILYQLLSAGAHPQPIVLALFILAAAALKPNAAVRQAVDRRS